MLSTHFLDTNSPMSHRIFLNKKIKSFYYEIDRLCYGLGMVMLGTAASMNSGQPYGRGWMDGDCYIVKNGVFGGAAVISIIAGFLILGFISTLIQHQQCRSTGPDVAVAVQGSVINKGSSCIRFTTASE
jgi:Protein of unknown function (DUF1218)